MSRQISLVRQPHGKYREKRKMEIEKAAVAGTMESSDCMVTVEDGDGNKDLVL